MSEEQPNYYSAVECPICAAINDLTAFVDETGLAIRPDADIHCVGCNAHYNTDVSIWEPVGGEP